MPGKHTAKQKRQAKHIVDSYRKGRTKMTLKRAKAIAWAVVNKKKSKKRRR